MGNCKRSIRYLSYILMVFELVLGLFVAPAAARFADPEPRLNLAPEFVETFDDPAAPGWNLSAGATVAGGILRLEPGGAGASHQDVWYNYTTVLRVRRTGPGAIVVTYITAGEESIRLVLDGESIEARRVLPGLSVDMIVERPIQGPPELPVGEWFRLYLAQLDGTIIVGVDGVRLCDLYDPGPEPLPPSGLALAAVGDAAVEIDEVTVIRWVIENFDKPLSSAWELSDVDATPFVEEGNLVVPQGGHAVRTGQWKGMTFYARLRRDRLVNAALTYPGHVLTLYENRIALSGQVEGQSQELAGAPLPEFPAEPETAMWMDVMVVVRNGEHHVLAYGVELFDVLDEVTGGAVSVKALEGELVLDRLMLGPPLPLWPIGEPGDGEPGEDPPGVPSADLAVTDLYPDQAPLGRLYMRITNNGPDTLQGVPVTVTCGGTATDVTSGTVTTIPDAPQGTFNIFLAPGKTQKFPTQINLDLNNFEYDLTCTVSAPLDSGAFIDPDPGNNTYTEQIAAIPPDAPLADLAVTDLFPDRSPIGTLYARITNNGPDALQAAPVTVFWNVQETDLATGMSYHKVGGLQLKETFNITIARGQTYEFSTGYPTDLDKWRHDASCWVSPVSGAFVDPVPGNDFYFEIIEALQHAQLLQIDLAVTDIFPVSLPKGDVYCRITNHGPDALVNASVNLSTYMYKVPYVGTYSTLWLCANTITVTLQPGETGEFRTGYTVDTNNYWYEFASEVSLSLLLDPDSSNNIYSETIPPPP